MYRGVECMSAPVSTWAIADLADSVRMVSRLESEIFVDLWLPALASGEGESVTAE